LTLNIFVKYPSNIAKDYYREFTSYITSCRKFKEPRLIFQLQELCML
jgi:hypothetical protein